MASGVTLRRASLPILCRLPTFRIGRTDDRRHVREGLHWILRRPHQERSPSLSRRFRDLIRLEGKSPCLIETLQIGAQSAVLKSQTRRALLNCL